MNRGCRMGAAVCGLVVLAFTGLAETDKDAVTYYWKATVAAGDWSNPDNWESSDELATIGYPKARKATADFSRCPGPTAVRLTEDGIYIDIVKFANGVDVTFTRDPSLETLDFSTWSTWWGNCANARITIDGIHWISHDTGSIAAGLHITVANGAFYETRTETQLHNAGATIEVKGRSTWKQADWTLSMNGTESRFILDDSTFVSKTSIWLARNSNGIRNTIEVKGKAPYFDCSGIFPGRDGTIPADQPKPRIIFTVPEGGYTAAPFRRGFLLGEKLKVDVLVAPETFHKTFGYKVSALLVDGPAILRDQVEHEGQVWANGFAFSYIGGAEGSNPSGLRMDYQRPGFGVVLR